jgi:hypothetical protein
MARGAYIEWGNLRVKQDRRLKGWKPEIWVVQPGTVAELEAAEQVIVRDGAHCFICLKAKFLVTRPNGEVLRETIILYQDGWKHLERIDHLKSYLDACMVAELKSGQTQATWREDLERDPPESNRILKAKEGPPLSVTRFLQASELVEYWESVGARASAGVEISGEEVLRMLNWAYWIGRTVRDAEVPSDLARARSAPNAQQRASEAKAWWLEGAAWAQSLVDAWPEGEIFSRNKLASKIIEEWSKSPKSSSWPAKIEHRDLYSRLLPKWIDLKILNLPGGD